MNAKSLSISFIVKNTGACGGTEVAELYVVLPPVVGESFRRLAGWQRVTLQAGEAKTVSIAMDKRILSIFDVTTHAWRMPTGEFRWAAGGSSEDLPLHMTMTK